MRCKKHYNDLSSINGVCATCLRQRLFLLIQQQSQPQTLTEQQEVTTNPTVYPRSVSPYRTRQHTLPDHRFFSTPQLGHNNNNHNYEIKKKKSFIKFSLLTNLFRSKKTHLISDDPNESATSSSSSPWFSIKSRHRGNDKRSVMTMRTKKQQFCPDRGMSPERFSDCESVGYESCQQTPWRTPARRVNSTAVSGLGFCLSPLVRASPCRNWNYNAAAVTTVMTSAFDGGDVRGAVKMGSPHFCANRSRKLADFGRLNPNR